eukprot:m.59773 g.59773  ORF g.59773 m.59773 type:complete len:80 (+) comp11782_c0_seq1:2722-2961(+)
MTIVLLLPLLSRISADIPSPEELTQKAEAHPERVQVLVSCLEDQESLQPYVDGGLTLYSTEIILSGALQQKVTFENWEL